MSTAETPVDDTVAEATALPEPRDAVVGWETFAAARLAWDERAAAPLDMLTAAYVRWAMADGRALLTEQEMLHWLAQRGAELVTGLGYRAVKGVRVID
jgi:hypothetical protein